MKGKSCDQCLLIFRPLGLITPEERLKNHTKHPHVIECRKCSKKFLSRTHLKFHDESYHRTRCGDCLGFCGSQCTIQFARRLELENKKMFNEGLIVKIEAAEAASRELEEFIMGKVNLSSSLAQDIGRLLDSGIETPEALHWSRLLYLPTAKYPMTTLTPRAKEWIELTILEIVFSDHKRRIMNAGLNECPETTCREVMFNNEHQCSNQSGAGNRRLGLPPADASHTEKPIPEREPEKEEESEVREINMMKKIPRADERHGKPTMTDEDFLEPLFKVILKKKPKADTTPTSQPTTEKLQNLGVTTEKGTGKNTPNRMEVFSMNLESGITKEQQPPNRMEILETTQPSKKTARDSAPTMERKKGSSVHMEETIKDSSKMEEAKKEADREKQNLDLPKLIDSDEEGASEGDTENEDSRCLRSKSTGETRMYASRREEETKKAEETESLSRRDNSETTMTSHGHPKGRAKSYSGMEEVKKKADQHEQDTNPPSLTDSEEEEEDSEDESEDEDLQHLKSTIGKENRTNVSSRAKNIDLNPVSRKTESIQVPHIVDTIQTVRKSARDPFPTISDGASRLKAPKKEANLDKQVTDPPSLTGTKEEEDSKDDTRSNSSSLLTGTLKATFMGKANTNVSGDSSDEDNEGMEIKKKRSFQPSGRFPGREAGAPLRDINKELPEGEDVEKTCKAREDRPNEEPKNTDTTVPGSIIAGEEKKMRLKEGIPAKESNCNRNAKAVAAIKLTSPESKNPVQSREEESSNHQSCRANLSVDKKTDDDSKIVLGYNEIQRIYFPLINEPAAVLQQFEVKLCSPRQRLSGINSNEQEESTMENLQSNARSGCTTQMKKTAKMTVISRGNTIQETYLDENAIPMEVDSCSLVSILAGHQMKDNLILEITERTELKFLNHVQSDHGIGAFHLKEREHPNVADLSDDPRRGGKRKTQGMPAPEHECRGKFQMEPNGTVDSNIGKIQKEEKASESDTEYEFQDAVSEAHELKSWSDKSTDLTRLEKTIAPWDTANDSGFNEQGEHFESASETNEEYSSSDEGKSEYSSDTDEEQYESAAEANEEYSPSENKSEPSVKYSPSDDEEESNHPSGRNANWLRYWDPIDDKYKDKKTHQTISETESETSEEYSSSDDEEKVTILQVEMQTGYAIGIR